MIGAEQNEQLPTLADAPHAHMHHPLADHLHRFATAPFLFVGAGLSRRYYNLDGWEALLRRFAEHTGHDYEYYKASASGDYPAIGQLIASDFHQIWWNSEHFAESRQVSKKIAISPSSALKIEICNYVKSATLTSDPGLIAELSILRESVIDGVITTNYDDLMEKVFPELAVYVGQDELSF